MKKLKILTSLPRYVSTYGNGHVAHSLAMGMNAENVISDMFSVHSELAKGESHVKQAIPSNFIYRVLVKLFGNQWVNQYTERHLRKLARNYDVIYLWPGYSLDTFHYLKSLGRVLVMECINGHQATAKKILDKEQQSLGIQNTHLITEQSIADESEKLALADFVFSPSPQVTKSLLENGVAAGKIIESSYGLSETQIYPPSKHTNEAPVFLFVGSVIMRKGVHLLLKYWQQANVVGKLKIVGKIDPAVDELLAPFKQDASIEFIPFTKDIDALYRSADVFVLPSLEEGSPLVTYLALGAGLACIVSPMGGDGIIREAIEGYIIEPHNENKWVTAFQELASNVELRNKMSNAARIRAEQFVWPVVAKRRREGLLNKLGE